VREGTLPSLYTLCRRQAFWRAHKLRRSVVPLQEAMHDSTATGANCDLLPDHPAPSDIACIFTTHTAANAMPRVPHRPWIRTLVIALDGRPRSRIPYLTTCHDGHDPAATDNWSLGRTLGGHYRPATCPLGRPLRTATRLFPAWARVHSLLISCYSLLFFAVLCRPLLSFAVLCCPLLSYAGLCWPMASGIPLSDHLVEYPRAHRVSMAPGDSPSGKARFGSQRRADGRPESRLPCMVEWSPPCTQNSSITICVDGTWRGGT
jgi:hypothetical protein